MDNRDTVTVAATPKSHASQLQKKRVRRDARTSGLRFLLRGQKRRSRIIGDKSGLPMTADLRRYTAWAMCRHVQPRELLRAPICAAACEVRLVRMTGSSVSNLADLDRLYAKVASEKGKIDILFAGAGIVDPQPLAETTEESFDKVFAINTRGLAFTVKKALPLLNDGGAIIVITSIAESKGIPGFPPTAPPRRQSADSRPRLAECKSVVSGVGVLR
jgi:NAD(P)-dependent dehydrogenase (short-subunit alcohol dehydrogenase family)